MSRFKRSTQRFLIGMARGLTPVLNLGGRTLVFRDADVREILSRDKDFTIRQINFEHIARHIGPFVLGQDDGPEYERNKGIWHSVLRKDDGQRIREFTRRVCKETLEALPGEFDLVPEYTRLLPWRMIANYIGVEGPNKLDFWHWNRIIFRDIFLELKENPAVRKDSMTSSKAMLAYMQELIAARKAVLNGGGHLPDDLLSRLLALQQTDAPSFDDDQIAHKLPGVFMGALEPINKAVCNALNEIFARKDVLEKAKAAAKADDIDTMNKICWEAMRFYPNAPLLMRYNEKTQTIGGNGRKKRTIKGGRTLFVMIGSAMFDKRAVPNPNRFAYDRPDELYLYFGMGLHKCYGTFINLIMIPEMIAALLRVDGIQPLAKTSFDGPFPNGWQFQKGS